MLLYCLLFPVTSIYLIDEHPDEIAAAVGTIFLQVHVCIHLLAFLVLMLGRATVDTKVLLVRVLPYAFRTLADTKV